MAHRRTDKIFDKLRRGELPAPPAHTASIETVNGKLCSGCDEMIQRLEHSYFVRIQGGTLLWFHLVCHDAWVKFKPLTHRDQS